MKITLVVDNSLDLGHQVGISYAEHDENRGQIVRTAVRASNESRSDVIQALLRLADQISQFGEPQAQSKVTQRDQPAAIKTLRDEFAMVVIQGILNFERCIPHVERLTATAYSVADAMLAERAK